MTLFAGSARFSRLLLALALAAGFALLAEAWRVLRPPHEQLYARRSATLALESLRHDRDFAVDERDRARARGRYGRDPWGPEAGLSYQPERPPSPGFDGLDRAYAVLALPAFLVGGELAVLFAQALALVAAVAFAVRRARPCLALPWALALVLVQGAALLLLVPGLAAFVLAGATALAALLPRWPLLRLGLVLGLSGALTVGWALLAGRAVGLLLPSWPETLLGRNFGLLLAAPFAFAALAAFATAGERRWARLGAGLLAVAFLAVLPGALEPRAELAAGSVGFACASPLFLALVAGERRRWPLVLGAVPALAWTLPAVLGLGLQGPAARPFEARWPAFTALPFEAELAASGRLPGYRGWASPAGGTWYLPAGSFFLDEHHPHGVWTTGATRAEVVLASPSGLVGETLPLRVHSLAGGRVRFSAGGRSAEVVFDSLAKKQGAPVSVPLERLPFPLSSEAWFRFTVEIAGGLVASEHDPKNPDRRYLGVFLDLTGGGP